MGKSSLRLSEVLGYLSLLSRCTPNYTITCLFLHAHYTETLKSSLEICEKKVNGEKHSFLELTYVVGAQWNCLNEAIPMCTNNICY